MRFKFAGDLDVPDFLLKEIDTLSKISVVRFKLIVSQAVKGILGQAIDVRCFHHAIAFWIRFTNRYVKNRSLHFYNSFSHQFSSKQFDKVENLVSKSNLSAGDVKGAIAGIDFMLKSACKYGVSDETLAMELNQLGLPKGLFVFSVSLFYVC